MGSKACTGRGGAEELHQRRDARVISLGTQGLEGQGARQGLGCGLHSEHSEMLSHIAPHDTAGWHPPFPYCRTVTLGCRVKVAHQDRRVWPQGPHALPPQCCPPGEPGAEGAGRATEESQELLPGARWSPGENPVFSLSAAHS